MLTLGILRINADIKKSGSNHLFFFLKSTEVDFVCKANSQSTPLILCSLNPESTHSKQE